MPLVNKGLPLAADANLAEDDYLSAAANAYGTQILPGVVSPMVARSVSGIHYNITSGGSGGGGDGGVKYDLAAVGMENMLVPDDSDHRPVQYDLANPLQPPTQHYSLALQEDAQPVAAPRSVPAARTRVYSAPNPVAAVGSPPPPAAFMDEVQRHAEGGGVDLLQLPRGGVVRLNSQTDC